MPVGMLPTAYAHLLWLTFHMTVLVFCVDWLWRFYGGSARLRWIGWAVGFAFIPSFFVLRMGQISPLILLGIVGFLHWEKKGQGAWVGAASALTAIKPDLVYLFAIATVLWSIDRRRWSVLAGGAIALVCATALPLAFNPLVGFQFREAISDQPPHMLSPT